MSPTLFGSLYRRGLASEGRERERAKEGKKEIFFYREKNDVGGLNEFLINKMEHRCDVGL
jgi:hypothetical protein